LEKAREAAAEAARVAEGELNAVRSEGAEQKALANSLREELN
jgi:hypothetical protein